jgi:hypothetical protein
VTAAEERAALRRIDEGILDARILLVTGRLDDECRAALVDELEALRLARIGVHCKGQREYLQRHGISAGLRKPVLYRGPAQWGRRVRAYLR